MRYERLWTRLTSPDTDVVSLGFSSVPWPLLNLPDSPEAITPELIAEFLFHAKRPGYDPTAKKRVVRDELLRWHPDKFSPRVLAQVANSAEQIRVSMGGDIVARALTELLTSK
ncbi:hypothetical protein DFH11DRAFT_1506926 [Phellopilus nigrolimitatus]|nr:hypothetical protein DFH11DRAFT_1506926 [Phellopilus nigrolimitatus]